MLEQSSLLLVPWIDPRVPRAILDTATQEALGSVRWRKGTPAWRGWLTAPVLEVREARDEPLLFTMHRYWNWGHFWQVREADGHRVATIAPGEVRNRADLRLAEFHGFSRPVGLEMRGRDGRPLAVVRRGVKGDALTFAAEVSRFPFVKMALLAAALVKTV